MDKMVNSISWFKHLLTEPASYWVNLIKKYFVDKPIAVVRGIPSFVKSIELQENEENRVAKRIEEFGTTGLNKWKNNLDEAKRINDVSK